MRLPQRRNVYVSHLETMYNVPDRGHVQYYLRLCYTHNSDMASLEVGIASRQETWELSLCLPIPTISTYPKVHPFSRIA